MTWTTAVVARRDFLGFFYRPRLDRSWGALFSYFTDRDAVCVYVIEKKTSGEIFPAFGSAARGDDVIGSNRIDARRTPRPHSASRETRPVRRTTDRRENGRQRTDGPHEQHALRMHG